MRLYCRLVEIMRERNMRVKHLHKHSGVGRESIAALQCPRCLRKVAAGERSVRCPHCAVWLHQTEEFPCWTHAPSCPSCGASTELGAGYSWTPDGI